MMTKSFFKQNKQSGVTLVEMLVVVAIFVIVGLAISSFSRDIWVTSGILQSSLSAQIDAKNVLRQFAAEVRTAAQSNTGAYALAEALQNSVKFYSDIDGDKNEEQVRYYLSADGKTLYKDVLKPTGNPLQYSGAPSTATVISNMANGAAPIFEYYDKNYDGATTPLVQPINVPDVRLIKITVIIDSNPNRSPTPITVTTEVSMRNLKDNL